jgi:hypothetical protein
MTTWADVQRGDAVKLGSRTLVVKKAKRDGKRVHVVIKDHLGTFERDVKAKDKVEVVQDSVLKIGGGIDFDKLGKQMGLHDDTGAQQRWAEPAESLADETPKPVTGSPWTTQADRAEEALATIGARLVAESHDGEKSWYVPPVDVSTVAAHWLVFHGGDPAMLDSMALLAHHNQQHKDYTTFKVPHTHTEVRP